MSVSEWSFNCGFRFSDKKTSMVVFQKGYSCPAPPLSLHIQNFTIVILSSVKFLGLTLDSKLLLATHIKLLREKCLNALNILKYLSHPRTGYNRKLLVQLYNSPIRSQLDYGAPIYPHSTKSSLK